MLEAKDSEERLEELADVLEVVQSLIVLENKTLDDVIQIALAKKKIRGGFEKKIFLAKVVD